MGLDAPGLLARAAELAERKSTLDQLPLLKLKDLASETVAESARAVASAAGGEYWWSDLVPIYKLGVEIYSKSRYKDGIQKQQWAMDWLKSGYAAKTEPLQRAAYKQAYSDAVHAMQLIAEEEQKGSPVKVLTKAAGEAIDKKAAEIRGDFLIGAGIAAGLLYLLSKNRDN